MAYKHLSVLRYSGSVVGCIPDALRDLENEHPLKLADFREAMVMPRRFYELEGKEGQDKKSHY